MLGAALPVHMSLGFLSLSMRHTQWMEENVFVLFAERRIIVNMCVFSFP